MIVGPQDFFQCPQYRGAARNLTLVSVRKLDTSEVLMRRHAVLVSSGYQFRDCSFRCFQCDCHVTYFSDYRN
jgi:hypothetical protein